MPDVASLPGDPARPHPPRAHTPHPGQRAPSHWPPNPPFFSQSGNRAGGAGAAGAGGAASPGAPAEEKVRHLNRRRCSCCCRTSARACQFLGHAACAHALPPRKPVPSTCAMVQTACFPHLTTRCWLLLCVPAQARQQCKSLQCPAMIPCELNGIIAGSPCPIEFTRSSCARRAGSCALTWRCVCWRRREQILCQRVRRARRDGGSVTGLLQCQALQCQVHPPVSALGSCPLLLAQAGAKTDCFAQAGGCSTRSGCST